MGGKSVNRPVGSPGLRERMKAEATVEAEKIGYRFYQTSRQRLCVDHCRENSR